MPVISITLLPGYSKQTEATMVRRLAQAARSVIDTPQAGTTVFVQQASTYQRDGQVFEGGRAAKADATQLVRRFLDHMERRELDAARALLAPDFAMQFPGSPAMHRLEELVDWARGRYRQVAKTYTGFDESWGDDATVVVCHGTLHGQWNDGSAFAGIRFIDRFEVTADRIRRQDVWNDLALHQPAPATPA